MSNPAKPIHITIGGKTFASVPELAAYYSSAEFESVYTYYGNDLGARVTSRGVTFKVWSPAAESIEVNLYKTGTDQEKGARFLGAYPLHQDTDYPGIWKTSLKGHLACLYYTYSITIGGQTQETADVYAKSCGVDGRRSMIIDLPSTNPRGWLEDHYKFTGSNTQAIVWETHVRDFSYAHTSGMQHRGQYLAFTENGTTVMGDGIHPTGVDYLKQLGITHVHLLPCADYATQSTYNIHSDAYNWGYDPLNYNCPEGSYSTDPYHGAKRVREMKQMILALHRAGIGVILDVVYNHTYYSDKSFQHLTMPYYYHRTMPDGSFANASGCGCETASDRSMMRLYMLDSIRYWAQEYHVDGFRFDLMGIHDVETMNEIRAMLDDLNNGKSYILYGEPWYALPPVMPKWAHPADMAHRDELAEGIAVFSDATRDAIKGSAFNVNDLGFINGGKGFEGRIVSAVKGQVRDPAKQRPTRTVTYASSHDNYTLWDKISLTIRGDGSGYDDPEMIRLAVNKLSAAIVLTSQGMPFFQSGEEFGRSKYSIENSYNSDTTINELRWQRTISFKELVDYYKGLIRIRKSFSPFSDPTSKALSSITFCQASDQVVAYTIKGQKKGEPRMMAVCFNASNEGKWVDLKNGQKEPVCTQWRVLANETSAGTKTLSEVSGTRLFVYLRGVLIAASEELLI